MNTQAKTIQIFLPKGDPRGIRIAEITTRIVQVIEVPRVLLSEFLTMDESEKVALYFLFSEAEDGTDKKVYVGQTGDLQKRLVDHDKKKAFWHRALILVSRTDSLTQTHTLFLEWHCLQAAKKAERYSDENGNAGSRPHTPAPLEADCMEIFEMGRTLLAVLGYPIFEPLAKTITATTQEELFHCTASGADGHGLYTPEGFVVLKGSKGRKENVASIVGTGDERLRQKLMESGVLIMEGDSLIFTKDHLFKTPSGAAVALTGRTANGWREWKNAHGKKLGDVKRPTTTE